MYLHNTWNNNNIINFYDTYHVYTCIILIQYMCLEYCPQKVEVVLEDVKLQYQANISNR